MFQVIVGMEKLGEFPKFTDAFRLFFNRVVDVVQNGTTLQWLETSNFIVYTKSSITLPIAFYDARDFAYDIGLLEEDGDLQNISEPEEGVVVQAFQKVSLQFLEGQKHKLLDIINTLEKVSI